MLHLFNTLTRKKEVFRPIEPGRVGLYTCGPTVYHYAHIGNLRTYVFEDILRRVLEMNGYAVRHIMNITDVGHLISDADTGEDKMEKGAAREKKSVWEIAQFYTDRFQENMRALHIMEPHVWCKATDHIAEQIALIERLEKKGCTYRADDGIYFDTSTFPAYGKLARLNIEGQKAGARVAVAEGKRNPTDFALWKFSYSKGRSFDAAEDDGATRRQMEWPSPWGVGFPGWHIECSAMAMKYLGEEFDIHTGGVDHVPVHHTNEIAQTEAATGKPFVHYWMHGEFLVLEGDAKMAKSAENFLTLQTLIDKGYDPLAYRYLLLTAHYRKKLKFSWTALDGAATALEGLRERLQENKRTREQENNTAVPQTLKKQFLSHINDDLDMPGALALLWDVLKSKRTPAVKIAFAQMADHIFALDLFHSPSTDVPADILALAKERDAARTEKNWARADELRKTIETKGWDVEDTPAGTRVMRS